MRITNWPRWFGFRSGVEVRGLGPGLWWYVPLFQSFQALKIKTQTEDLRAQSITTADGKSVVVSGAIQWKITDVKKALLDVYDLDRNLLNTALGVIAKFVNGRTFEACKDIESLEAEILKGTREAAAGWGAKITEVFITDLVEAKTYRLIGGAQGVVKGGDQSDDSELE